MRVLLVAYNASTRFGGEAMLPVRWFEHLRQHIDVELLTHVRNRAELEGRWGPAAPVHYIDTERWSRKLHRLNRLVLGTDSGPAAAFLFGGVDWLLFDRAAAQWIRRRGKQAASSVGAERRRSRRAQTVCSPGRAVPARASRPIARRGRRPRLYDVVHRVIPVSPHWPCLYHSLGSPVVVGPLNGGFMFPPGFERQKAEEKAAVVRLRPLARFAHTLAPGLERAAAILAANETTRQSLPRALRNRVELLCENGVDTERYRPAAAVRSDPLQRVGRDWRGLDRLKAVATDGGRIRFLYAGRLVPYKCPDLLIDALARVRRQLVGSVGHLSERSAGPAGPRLTIIGDGPLRPRLEERVAAHSLGDDVIFTGALPPEEVIAHFQQADVFCLPSIREPGGAAILEAMACAVPSIVADYGGPAEYVTAETGLKVPLPSAGPEQEEQFVAGLADAMLCLACDPELRQRMGKAARRHVLAHYTWEAKVERMLAIYRRAGAVPGDGKRAEGAAAHRDVPSPACAGGCSETGELDSETLAAGASPRRAAHCDVPSPACAGG